MAPFIYLFMTSVVTLGTIIGSSSQKSVDFQSGTTFDTIKNLPNFLVFYVENLQLIHYLYTKFNEGNQGNTSKDVVLPHLSSLINSSIHFHKAYTEMSAVSSIASFLTGKPAVDTGIIQGKILPYVDFPSLASSGGLPNHEETIADGLISYGYESAFIGQWQLGLGNGGAHLPVKHGFDMWTGALFSNAENCKKPFKSSRARKDRFLEQPYLNFIVKTYQFWLAILVVLLTMYYFGWLYLKGLANAFIYCVCTSLILYLLLRVLQVQKTASCVLYRNFDIKEQPYSLENLTLYTTMEAVKFLNDSRKALRPFYLHLSYLKVGPPYFFSSVYGGNRARPLLAMLTELDWSIGKILMTVNQSGLSSNTVIILTGTNGCFMAPLAIQSLNFQPYGTNQILGYTRIGYQKFTTNNYALKDTFETCIKLPLFLKWPFKNYSNFRTDSLMSIADIFPTIQNIVGDANGTYSGKWQKNSCSMYSISQEEESVTDEESAVASNDTEIVSNLHTNDAENQHEANKSTTVHRKNKICTLGQRTLFHYADIIRPVAVTLSGQIRIVFLNITATGKVVPLPKPVIFFLSMDAADREITEQYLEEVFQNASSIVDKHLQEERPNRWTSQFEMPVYPWYFPCAHFPKCELNRVPDDFSSLDVDNE